MFRRTFSLVAVFAMALATGYLLIKPESTQNTDNFELPFAASAQSANTETADTMPLLHVRIAPVFMKTPTGI